MEIIPSFIQMRRGLPRPRDSEMELLLDSPERLHCLFIPHIAGIQRALGLDQTIRVSPSAAGQCSTPFGTIKNSPGRRYISIMQLHQQLAHHHQKQFVFIVMMVPNELAIPLHHFYVRVIHFAHNPGIAVVGEERKFLGEIYLVVAHLG
jgi:hypothetical protein